MLRAIKDYRLLKKHQLKSSLKEVLDYQWNQTLAMVSYARKHSPFYQKLYEGFEIETIEDFKKLPTINKNIMMEHFSTINTAGLVKEDVLTYALKKEMDKDYLGYYKDQYVIGLSSGTSGNKGVYITPKNITKRLPAVFLARGGVSLKDLPLRILFLLRVFSQGFNDINAPFIKLKYVSTMTEPKVIVDMINLHKINVLMAPPSLMRILMPFKDQIKVKLKKIVTYAEVLTDIDQLQFEKAFHTKVVEIYQASEGQIASPCPLGYLHINEDMVHVELYDEEGQEIIKPFVVGQKMIITNLINQAQPLIRYEMNDMIVLDEPCLCGSHFRRIKSVLGRSDDLIYFYDENNHKKPLFPDLFARFIITFSDDIREFKVIQDEIGKATIILDLINPIDLNGFESMLHHQLESYQLKGQFQILIETITLPKHNQKYKRFINQMH